MPQLGPAEVLVILVVALLVFGPKRLPEVGRQVGRGLHELRKIQETVRDELNDVLHAPDEASADEPSTTSPSSGDALEPPNERPALPPTKARPAPSRYRAPGT